MTGIIFGSYKTILYKFLSYYIVSTMASSINQLLVAHDNTERQLAAFDGSVTRLSQKMFSASSQSENLHLLLRLSVTEGVQDMFTRYHKQTTQKVLEKSLHEADTILEQTSSRLSLSPSTGNRKTDKAAGIWTSTFCEFYRGS